MILDTLSKELMEEVGKLEGPYKYENYYVPRVNTILSDMIHVDALMGWSNYLGFKRQNYKKTLDEAAYKGTFVHNSIEDYIMNKEDLDIESIDPYYKKHIKNSYQAFLSWWEIIIKNSYKVIFMEQSFVCPWFGGTVDMFIMINGKYYIVDFKTSSRITDKYIVQLCAYKYMLEQKGYTVDGIIILRLDKETAEYDEFILNMVDYDDNELIKYATEYFFSLVQSYYYRINVEKRFQLKLKER